MSTLFRFTGLSLLFFIPCLAGADTTGPSFPPENIKEYVYKTVGNVKLALDVFTPPGYDVSKPGPVLIFFHGGGWGHGDKRWHGPQDSDPTGRYFALRGIVSVSANYRFIKKDAQGIEGTKEICDIDGKSAIRWVLAHASELGIDPHRLILGGESAGTQIALFAGLNTTVNDPVDDLSIAIKPVAFLLFNPALFESGYKNEDPQIEPFAYVSSAVPPTIFFSGENDASWRKTATNFLNQCKAAGAKGEMWIAPGQSHAFTGKAEWEQATCVKADAFLVSLGLLASPSPPLALPEGTSLLTPEEFAARPPATP